MSESIVSYPGISGFCPDFLGVIFRCDWLSESSEGFVLSFDF